MKIVFFGTGAFAVPALEALAAGRHEVLSAVTPPDKPRGRFLKTAASAVRQAAERLKVPVHVYAKERAAETSARLRQLEPDFFVTADFGFLLSADLLSVPRVASLNIHPSLLPRHRGASPMPWTILEGDAETGVTVIRMNARMDAGEILAQAKTPVGPGEDLPALEKRLSQLGARLIVETLDAWEAGRVRSRPQDEAAATYTRKFSKEDAALDFTLPAEVLERRVRALKGWPGTHAAIRGRRLLVHAASAVPGSGEPGSVLLADERGTLVVAAGKGALRLDAVQLEGRKPMPVGDFLRGFPVRPGERFESPPAGC